MGRVNKKNAGGRPEKLERIPAFLAALVEHPTIATAAKTAGIGPSTILRYLVRSRMGDPELQAIESAA